MELPLPFVFAVQQGIATVLRLDPHTAKSLDDINGKVIKVDVTSPPFEFHLIVVDNEIQVEGAFDAEPDTVISGSALDLLSLRNKTDALYTGDVKITGELSTGDHLRSIINNLDLQVEDVVAPITGDTVAHQLGRFGKQFANWFDEVGASFKSNTSEYLQEEAELLAPNSEIQRFGSEVDTLRESCDRLEARIAVLEKASMQKAKRHD